MQKQDGAGVRFEVKLVTHLFLCVDVVKMLRHINMIAF